MTQDRTPASASGLTSLWHDLVRGLFAGYRPERHYMRGPGPAFRAKHRLT